METNEHRPRCTYRRIPTECRNASMKCENCLRGQICDLLELHITATGNLTASIEERKIA